MRVRKEGIDSSARPKAARDILAALSGIWTESRDEADLKTFRVHAPAEIDVRKIRRRLKLSQVDLASKFGLSVATVRGNGSNIAASRKARRARC